MFECSPINLINRRVIEVPKQKLSRNPVVNGLGNLAFLGLEKLLQINRDIQIVESDFESPVRTRFPETDRGVVRCYNPKEPLDRAVIVLPQRGAVIISRN